MSPISRSKTSFSLKPWSRARVDYFLVWFSASHAFYFDGECVVLFYSVDVEVGESA